MHARVADARRDFSHKASTRLVRENDVIVVEDLNVAGMVRNRGRCQRLLSSDWMVEVQALAGWLPVILQIAAVM